MKNKKAIFVIVGVIVALILIGVIIFAVSNKSKTKETSENTINILEEEQDVVVDNTIDIIDINSASRPFAISINNTPEAVKVQEGLNKAYLIYEIPTEGNTSRLLAFFKDTEDVKIGTIRSARHNFIDYALESDAIFCSFGWSHYAQDDMQKNKSIDYIQGLFDKPFWRENPENLAYEHTVYTTTNKLKENATSKNINLNSSSASNTILLNYNTSDIDLSKKEGATVANNIEISYGASFNTTFKYDEENKIYNRYQNGEANTDYTTKEQFNTKNIIVQKVKYNVCADNYYWDLHLEGNSGEGYFISNGYSVPIKWSKQGRNDKTKYTYLDGTEIEVSDGRTYIEVQTTNQTLTINE